MAPKREREEEMEPVVDRGGAGIEYPTEGAMANLMEAMAEIEKMKQQLAEKDVIIGEIGMMKKQLDDKDAIITSKDQYYEQQSKYSLTLTFSFMPSIPIASPFQSRPPSLCSSIGGALEGHGALSLSTLCKPAQPFPAMEMLFLCRLLHPIELITTLVFLLLFANFLLLISPGVGEETPGC